MKAWSKHQSATWLLLFHRFHQCHNAHPGALSQMNTPLPLLEVEPPLLTPEPTLHEQNICAIACTGKTNRQTPTAQPHGTNFIHCCNTFVSPGIKYLDVSSYICGDRSTGTSGNKSCSFWQPARTIYCAPIAIISFAN